MNMPAWDWVDTVVSIVAVLLIFDAIGGGLGRGLIRIWRMIVDVVRDVRFRWSTRR